MTTETLPDGGVASFDEERATWLRRAQYFLHAHPTAIPAIVLIVALVGFSVVVGERFLHPFNFSLILQQVTIIGIVAVAQTLIILTAGIDLSVGAMLVLSSVAPPLAVAPAGAAVSSSSPPPRSSESTTTIRGRSSNRLRKSRTWK